MRGKLALAFGLVLALFMVAGVGVLRTLSLESEDREAGEHARGFIDASERLILGMREVQVAVRGTLLTGADSYAKDYHRALAGTRAAVDAMEAAGKGDAERMAQAVTARREIEQWIADYVEPEVEPLLKRAGEAPVGVAREEINRYLTEAGVFASRLIDSLTRVIEVEQVRLEERSTSISQSADRTFGMLVAMLVAGLLVGIFSLMFSERLVTQPIRRLTDLMTRLAGDDHGIEVPQLERRDEIGAIARALDTFKRTSIERRDDHWVKSSVTAMGSALHTANDRLTLANTVVNELSVLLGAGVAVFYVYEQEEAKLSLFATYGLQQRRHNTTRYALGEGLVGQCALERKSIILDPVPDDYTRVHSGTGEAVPRCVVVAPLLVRDNLLGVVEFGMFTPLSGARQKLLAEMLPMVSSMLDGVEGAQRTRELLERTRAQASELAASEETLRVQQEELRSTNDELQGKTVELEEQSQRLRSSEEELRVQAEELQASNEELREKSETLNEQKLVLEMLQRETERRAEELGRASQYKSDFLASMSHELRTPLNSMLILSRTLSDNDEGNLSQDQVESARVIHDAGSNLLRLINDILDLSKIEAGKMEVAAEEVTLRSVSHALARVFRPQSREKELEFTIAIDEAAPPSVHTDGGKLQQILSNLLGNAIKFTAAGSVRVDLRRCDPERALRHGLSGPALAISVTDTGIGIPPEELGRIFRLFEQVDSGLRRQYAGTGLGLSIARSLAQLLGGDIEVESEVGRGSTFTVILPVTAPQGMAPEPVDEPVPSKPTLELNAMPRITAPLQEMPWINDDRATIRPGDTSILTIEDDPAFARILVDMIRRKGCRALAARDGETGIRLAHQYRPAGILLDVMLPGIDGWQVIEHLKRDSLTQSIPVHFVSAIDEGARARELGAIGFLTKPVERDALRDAFDRLLQSVDQTPRKVLVVDDDEDSFLAVEVLIASESVQVVRACTGEEGLQMVREEDFACIVLDLGLPDINGQQFLERASRFDSMPPVVIYTAAELSREQALTLRQYTDSIVIKGTRSPERLFDEVKLFLHRVRGNAPALVERNVDDLLSGRTVLVVDDDMRNIFALSKTLRAKGLNVVMAQDGRKALRQLEENSAIEIVLMDIMMPVMDGYQTIREIRAQPRHAKLPIIAVTAKAMAGDREKCVQAGANDYLSKPIDVDKLVSMMRVWLQA